MFRNKNINTNTKKVRVRSNYLLKIPLEILKAITDFLSIEQILILMSTNRNMSSTLNELIPDLFCLKLNAMQKRLDGEFEQSIFDLDEIIAISSKISSEITLRRFSYIKINRASLLKIMNKYELINKYLSLELLEKIINQINFVKEISSSLRLSTNRYIKNEKEFFKSIKEEALSAKEEILLTMNHPYRDTDIHKLIKGIRNAPPKRYFTYYGYYTRHLDELFTQAFIAEGATAIGLFIAKDLNKSINFITPTTIITVSLAICLFVISLFIIIPLANFIKNLDIEYFDGNINNKVNYMPLPIEYLISEHKTHFEKIKITHQKNISQLFENNVKNNVGIRFLSNIQTINELYDFLIAIEKQTPPIISNQYQTLDTLINKIDVWLELSRGLNLDNDNIAHYTFTPNLTKATEMSKLDKEIRALHKQSLFSRPQDHKIDIDVRPPALT